MSEIVPNNKIEDYKTLSIRGLDKTKGKNKNMTDIKKCKGKLKDNSFKEYYKNKQNRANVKNNNKWLIKNQNFMVPNSKIYITRL